jgi:stage II sporulation protein D
MKSRALAIWLLMAGVALAQAAAPGTKTTLRVGLWTLWHDKEVTVSAAPAAIALLANCENCSKSPISHPLTIHAGASGVALAGGAAQPVVFLSGALKLTAHGETITLHNPVRVSTRNGELVLAVTLPVESYVERVVASESGPADSLESLKALAVVVRSFALHQPHGHADFDLCDSTHCQLLHWAGGSGRQTAAHQATLATAGQTLWFHGRPAQAWFHQNCGGRTAAPGEVWPGAGAKPMPWLVSHSDPYCTASGAREWSANLSLSDLTQALAAAGLVRPGWKSLTVARRGESGRAVTLKVGQAEIAAEDFRLAVGRSLGWGKILSNWYEVSGQGGEFAFHGRGSGHGVGLCQAGAAAMAGQGHDAGQILAQYFPGAEPDDEATGRPWQSLRGQGFQLETLAAADSRYLPEINQALAEAEDRSGLRPTETIAVRTFPSVSAFRNATLAPGWVAAFTEGNWIGTQPLATLAARKFLAPVLRHEFLHVLVEAQAGPSAPLWLREGLVELWAGSSSHQASPLIKLDTLNATLAHAATEADSEKAHRASAFYAKRLLDRYGRAQVLAWLQTGLPANIVDAIH